LVVIAVIALLMAILLPALQRVRRQTRAVICRSNLRQWGHILALYAEDSQGQLPNRETGWMWLLRGSAPSADDPLKPHIYNNVQTKDIARCPEAMKPTDARGWQVDTEGDPYAPKSRVKFRVGSTHESWQIMEPGPSFFCSYGFNEWLTMGAMASRKRVRHYAAGWDVFSLKERYKIPALLDSKWPYGHPKPDNRPPQSYREGANNMKCFCMNRHNGHINGLFLDWSVRRIGLKELWTVKWHPGFNTEGPWTQAGGVERQDWPQWMRPFKDY